MSCLFVLFVCFFCCLFCAFFFFFFFLYLDTSCFWIPLGLGIFYSVVRKYIYTCPVAKRRKTVYALYDWELHMTAKGLRNGSFRNTFSKEILYGWVVYSFCLFRNNVCVYLCVCVRASLLACVRANVFLLKISQDLLYLWFWNLV